MQSVSKRIKFGMKGQKYQVLQHKCAIKNMSQHHHHQILYQRDGIVVKASVLQSVDLGFISKVELCQKALKNGIHCFPAWRSANRDSVENKPASLLVVSLGKALNEMPPSLCARQMVGPSSLPNVVASV